MVVPRNLNDSVSTVLSIMVIGGVWECLLSSTLFWVCQATCYWDCTRPPAVQPSFNMQTHHCSDAAGDCSVTCKHQDLDRGDLWSAASHVQREEQWGENTSLRGASADHESPRCEFPQPHLLLPVCHEAEPIEWRQGELGQFIWEKIRHDGIEGQKVEIGFFINKTQTTYQIRLCLKILLRNKTQIFFYVNTHTHTHTHAGAHTNN